MKSQNLRLITELGIFVVVILGLVTNIGIGDTCVFGWDQIAAICPLGIIETFLAGKSVSGPSLLCLAITLVITIVLGRAACGWFCPVPLVRRIFGGQKNLARHYSDVKDAGISEVAETAPLETTGSQENPVKEESTVEACKVESCTACAGAASCVHAHSVNLKTNKLDTRHAVLIATLASTAILGFPVFCLICPVGLSIATFIGVWNLIGHNEGTWMIVLMPAILILELTVLKKWCHRICPISALFSLIANANRTFRPTIDSMKCLRETEKSLCNACYYACPEGINLHNGEVHLVGRNECIKCRKCIDACPVNAISMPFLPKKQEEVAAPVQQEEKSDS